MWLKCFLIFTLLIGVSQAAWNVTCDFDLENIENIVEYLPIECQKVYASGSTSELYSASIAESKKYQEFRTKLVAYENENSLPIEEEALSQNTTLRFEIYNAVMLSDCLENLTGRTDSLADEAKMKEYYDCLLKKRGEMIDLIPK